MKNFIAGFVLAVLVVATLAAEGGYSVVWEYELKRPEAQRAIADYVQKNCSVALMPWRVKQLREALKDGDGFVVLDVGCAAPPTESK